MTDSKPTPGADHFLRWAQLTCAGEVAAIIAHDINNAVTGVMSYTELAQMDLPTWGEAETYLGKTLEQARRISNLANRMLLVSHEAAPYLAPQSLQESLETACALVRRRLEKDHIAVEHSWEVDGIQVTSDAGRLLLTWLGLILVARSALVAAGPEGHKRLGITAVRTVNETSPVARVSLEATTEGPFPASFVQELQSVDGGNTPARREGMLYAASGLYLSELRGTLAMQSAGDRLLFTVELPTGV